MLVAADYLEVNKNLAHKKLKYWFDKDLAILLAKKIREHYLCRNRWQTT